MSHKDVARDLVREHGQTYAEQAGITLRDKPSPLFQLLVLTMLSSARIAADVAVASARELFAAGWRRHRRSCGTLPGRNAWTPWSGAATAATTRAPRPSLEKLATHVIDVHDGDLRRFRPSRARAWTTSSPH